MPTAPSSMGDGQPKRSSHAVPTAQGGSGGSGGGSGRGGGGGGGGGGESKSLKERRKKKQTQRHKSAMASGPDDILRTGREYLSKMGDSPFFTANPPRTLPEFERTELGFGKKLGSGAFCNVSEILAMKLKPPEAKAKGVGTIPEGDEKEDEGDDAEDCAATAPSTGHSRMSTMTEGDETEEGEGEEGDDNDRSGVKDLNAIEEGGESGNSNNDDDEDEDEAAILNQFNEHLDMVPTAAREYMSAQCLRDGDARYAVKRLRTDLSDMEAAKGIVDLAVEAKFLSSIYHPNIIKMRGTTTAATDPLGPDNFIVMDRLYDTLEERIDQWAVRRRMAGGCMGCFGGDAGELNMLMCERLTAAYDVASVFRYLHGNKLVYRDIKPDNMGFDVRGDIKVFDFGLCKELTPKLKNKDGTYNLTGLTGSRRYMAPEVVLCKPYGPTADVFSYGVLLWQILALETPFEQFDPRDHTEQVVKGGYRPPIQSSWPVMTRGILKECWDDKPKERPDFVRIASVLKGELTQIADEGDAGGRRKSMLSRRSMHMMRKSQHSFRLNARGMNGSGRGGRL